MCRLKWVLLVILAAFPVLSQSNLKAANTAQIDNVRSKTVLNDRDKKVIDDFIRESVNALINERDYTNIARHRNAIVSRKGSKQGQYLNQFKESNVSHITKAFETIKDLKPTKHQTFVITNLLILIDKLQNVQLSILAKNMLDNENTMVRYWAAKCLSNPEVISQLNSGEPSNPGLIKEITTQFINIVPMSSVEVLDLIARYAAAINIPEGQELLLKIADQRIETYANWQVKHEYEDGDILRILADRIIKPKDNANIPAIAQRFAQLYSYVIQRYIKTAPNLDKTQKFHLESIIIEIEDKCIRKMVGTEQNMRKAIANNMLSTLKSEHDKLLGSNVTTGQLPAKYNFNYSTDDNLTVRNAPLTLPDPK